MIGMRAGSSCGRGAAETEGGRTEADNCFASVVRFGASSNPAFRTEKGDRAHSPRARAIAVGSEKDSAVDRDA